MTKLSERASERIYLGRSEDKSAYIVRVKESGKILVTAHVMFVEGSFPGIGACRDEPEVNSYINPLSASKSEPVGRAAAGQAPPHNSAEHDSVREANVDHAESVPPASWSR